MRMFTATHLYSHIDISCINISGSSTTYVACWTATAGEIREQMTEADAEMILLRAKEKFPQARPWIISDNGPQFVAHDFNEFVRFNGVTHMHTSLYYPQSNSKKARWYGTLKQECIRPKTPLDLADARRMAAYVLYYNEHRLHSAIGYVVLKGKLEGREQRIFAERKEKLQEAWKRRIDANKIPSATVRNSLLAASATS